MLRISVLLAMALAAVSAHAQVSGDPLAAAPVVFDGAPADAGAGAGMSVDGVMGAPGQDAGADQQPMQDDQQPMNYADTGDYADAGYQYPVYDTADYDAPYYYAPAPFYLGVSLLPYWYPSFGFGFGYGFASFGFGFGFPVWGFGGFYGHHYYAWNGNHWNGWNSFHGPYRYFGAGHYADHFNAAGFARTGSGFANRGATFANRSGAFATSARTGSPSFARGQATNARGNLGIGRTTMPSSSYYATSQRTNFATGRATYNTGAGNVRGSSFAPNTRSTVNASGQRNWVTSMPNRDYAATPSRSNEYSQYARGNGSAYASQRNYGAPRGNVMPQQHYNGAAQSSRGYYGGHVPSSSYSRGAQSYSSRGAAPAPRSSGGGNGGGGHESEGSGSHKH